MHDAVCIRARQSSNRQKKVSELTSISWVCPLQDRKLRHNTVKVINNDQIRKAEVKNIRIKPLLRLGIDQ